MNKNIGIISGEKHAVVCDLKVYHSVKFRFDCLFTVLTDHRSKLYSFAEKKKYKANFYPL